MSSPVPTATIVGVYIFVVKVLGPNLMKDRKPIDCRNFLFFYNIFQVLLSAYIFVEVRSLLEILQYEFTFDLKHFYCKNTRQFSAN